MKESIDRLYKKSAKNYSKFKPISDYIVEHYVGDPVDGHLTNEERNVISTFSAMDMYIVKYYKDKKEKSESNKSAFQR